MGVHTFAVIALFCFVLGLGDSNHLLSLFRYCTVNLHDTNMGDKGNRRSSPKDIVQQQESLDCRMRSRRMRSQGNFSFSLLFFLFLLSLTVLGRAALVSDIGKSNMINWFLLVSKLRVCVLGWTFLGSFSLVLTQSLHRYCAGSSLSLILV